MATITRETATATTFQVIPQTEATANHDVQNAVSSIVTVPTGNLAFVPPKTHVNVVAPTDIPEGFEFCVEHEGSCCVVRVPPGGARQGQTFQALVVARAGNCGGSHNIPYGHFRDTLFDCVNEDGPLVMACCCQPCAMGQLLTRLNLDLCGNPTQTPGKAYKTFFWATASLYGTTLLLGQLGAFFHWFMIVYMIFLTFRVYRYVHRKFGIRHDHATYDPCTAFSASCFCGTCVISQLLRHTADHRKYAYTYCNARGLPLHAPGLLDDDHGVDDDPANMEQLGTAMEVV